MFGLAWKISTGLSQCRPREKSLRYRADIELTDGRRLWPKSGGTYCWQTQPTAHLPAAQHGLWTHGQSNSWVKHSYAAWLHVFLVNIIMMLMSGFIYTSNAPTYASASSVGGLVWDNFIFCWQCSTMPTPSTVFTNLSTLSNLFQSEDEDQFVVPGHGMPEADRDCRWAEGKNLEQDIKL